MSDYKIIPPEKLWFNMFDDGEISMDATQQAEEAVPYVQQSKLTAAEQKNERLRGHLIQAMKFIECTYGKAATTGILQCGNDKSTAFNVDEAKQALKEAGDETE